MRAARWGTIRYAWARRYAREDSFPHSRNVCESRPRQCTTHAGDLHGLGLEGTRAHGRLPERIRRIGDKSKLRTGFCAAFESVQEMRISGMPFWIAERCNCTFPIEQYRKQQPERMPRRKITCFD